MARSKGTRFGCIIATTAIVCVAVALGVGLGVGLNNRHSDSKAASVKDTANNAAAASPSASSSSAAHVANSTSNAAAADVVQFTAWDWTSTTNKMLGISLGNWLVLERWMNEDWFVETAGTNNVWDEWTWTNAVGSNASAVLADHWNTWITEDDINTIADSGFNHIRIPLGFWALIPTTGDEPYVSSGQLEQINRILPYANARGLYVMLDLHGLPGSQNGEQQSGHNTSNIQFWTDTNQARGDATVAAAISYIQSSPYSSMFSSLAVCNEPVTYTDGQLDTLKGFYSRSYATISALSTPLPMVFHHARQGVQYWKSWVTGKNPKILIIEDHPYPGNFPLQYQASDILNQVCTKAKSYQNFPVPVTITEFSLTTGITDPSFEKTFYAAQVTAFSWSGGAVFWSYKAMKATNPVLSVTSTISQYSFVDSLASGAIATPSSGQMTAQFIASLDQQCGSSPNETWTSPASKKRSVHF